MPQNPRSRSPTPQEVDEPRSFALEETAGPVNGDLFAMEDELLAERPSKSAADRQHGLKTRDRNKQIVSGKPYG